MPRLYLRCTEEDLLAWKAKAESAGMTLSDLARSSMAKAKLPDRERQAELARLTRDIARIGNNLNQLARWANTYKGTAEALEVIGRLVAIEREIHDVHKNLSEG